MCDAWCDRSAISVPVCTSWLWWRVRGIPTHPHGIARSRTSMRPCTCHTSNPTPPISAHASQRAQRGGYRGQRRAGRSSARPQAEKSPSRDFRGVVRALMRNRRHAFVIHSSFQVEHRQPLCPCVFSSCRGRRAVRDDGCDRPTQVVIGPVILPLILMIHYTSPDIFTPHTSHLTPHTSQKGCQRLVQNTLVSRHCGQHRGLG